MKRRQFISDIGKSTLMLLAPSEILPNLNTTVKTSSEFVFVETEQFAKFGGWELDQQSMDQMGSPYLLAHGLGVPVEDATTEIKFPANGKYRLWVRTRDWVAPWKVEGAPGKFQLLINEKPVKEVFGTKGAEWHWHDGGIVEVTPKTKLSLHDLTGFEGRCEAILFCKDVSFEPVNDIASLTKFRRELLGLSLNPKDGGNFDLVVVGGGFAGTAAALSAARNGLKVALIQDRPVLGGNGSSEVRVWPEGHIKHEPYPHIGDIVDEISPAKVDLGKYGTRNARMGNIYNDQLKLDIVKAEPRITLFLEERVLHVEYEGKTIKAVISQNTRTSIQTKINAKLFADCSGDAIVGYLAGADYEISGSGIMGFSNMWNVMDAANKEEVLQCECKDKTALSMSCEIGNIAQPFPRCPWAIDLSDKPFPGRSNFTAQWGPEDPLGNLGGWFWESGFDKDPINDVEKIRDLNFRAMYGAWDTLKNVDKLYPNHRLGWSAYISGKRESRRLLGDLVLNADNFRDMVDYPDAVFPCTWGIDVHSAHKSYSDAVKGEEFIAFATTGKGYEYKGPYWAPYRTLYSRNISNLFMAGRNISVSHDGLGPVRVMKTCGMMGEIVGKAAAVCIQHNASPREIYEKHLEKLKLLMKQPGSKRV